MTPFEVDRRLTRSRRVLAAWQSEGTKQARAQIEAQMEALQRSLDKMQAVIDAEIDALELLYEEAPLAARPVIADLIRKYRQAG